MNLTNYGKVEYLKIAFLRQNGIFHAGESITGFTSFKLTDRIKINSFIVYVHGISKCRWTETEGKHTKTHSSEFDIINSKAEFLTQEKFGNEIFLDPGEYSYNFEIKLPNDLPTSYKDKIGKIQYDLKACLDIAWSLSKNTTLDFKVINPLDLNKLKNDIVLDKPLAYNGEKNYCCCYCATDPLHGELILPLSGFIPGDKVKFTAKIDNKSSRTIKSLELRLIKQVVYITPKKTKVKDTILKKVFDNSIIPPKTTYSWDNSELEIPFVRHSSNKDTPNVDLRYLLALVARSALAINFYVKAPITIGYIPLTINDYAVEPYTNDNTVEPIQPTFYQIENLRADIAL